ncbi:MAG: imidazolonepropionase [Saprospirales bacterium]|nr:imidazolonepropionase [Saprospirales bacterium]
MSTLLIRNAQQLIQCEVEPRALLRGKTQGELPVLEDGYVLIENGRIASFGPSSEAPDRADKEIDAHGKLVLPCWVDSHTHLIFAGSREGEFADRIKGLSYEEIARRGGGILNSAKLLRETPETQLREQAYRRLLEVQGMGTGAIEVKSGYGLSLDSELKMLRVARWLKEVSSAPVKATFLGAHTIPMEYRARREEYVDLLVREMIPRIAGEGLADYIDVFCEKVAFTVEEMDTILEAGARYGLKPKVHVNQFNVMGGISTAVKHSALSVDHLEVVGEEDFPHLKGGKTIATLLPSAPFFLNDHYPPARKLIEEGVAVALATDYNPGSSPSGSMPLVLSLACIKLRMTPEEAINAATLNGAYALELEKECGSIAAGKRADLLITRQVPSVAFLPYAFGSDWVDQFILNGEPI